MNKKILGIVFIGLVLTLTIFGCTKQIETTNEAVVTKDIETMSNELKGIDALDQDSEIGNSTELDANLNLEDL